MNTKNFAEALGSIFDIAPQRHTGKVLQAEFLRPSSGQERDAMAKDFSAVGKDIRLSMEQHVQR
jgi:hypothetical protein